MDLQSETCKQILAKLKDECRWGRLKNRTHSILVFAELTQAGITEEEFHTVRKFLSGVLRHSRAIRRALRRGDEQMGKMRGALSSKSSITLDELGTSKYGDQVTVRSGRTNSSNCPSPKRG